MILLVTGGCGFIGSNFIHYILKNHPDYQIINLDALTYAGNLENLKSVEDNPNYKFVKGDICDGKLVNELIREVDAVVNFAAESHVDRSILDAQNFIRTNVVGTYTLLEAAKNNGSKRFHHVSTDEVYGDLGPDDPAFNESTPYAPSSPYSASKASSDHLVRAYHRTFGLPITISNCSNNYGPFQFPEKLIPLLITNIKENKKLPVYGDGKQVRDWIFVDDHNRGVDMILEKGKIGETYCLGGKSEKENIEIVKLVLEKMGGDESLIEYVKDRPGHDRRYAIDFSKAKNKLDWEPQVSFEEGMEKTINWYKKNEAWWKNVKSGDYQKYYKEQYNTTE